MLGKGKADINTKPMHLLDHECERKGTYNEYGWQMNAYGKREDKTLNYI